MEFLPITIKTKIDFETYKQVSYYLLYRVFGAFTFILLFAFLYHIIHAMVSFKEGGFLSVGYIIAFSLAYFLMNKSLKKKYNNPNFGFKNNLEFVFDNKGYSLSFNQGNVNYLWNNIKEIKETKRWFLLFISKNQSHIIPKAQLLPTEQEDLRKLFSKVNVKKKKLLN